MRSVDENSAEGTDVGDPVMASYTDSYALSGTDAASFSIDGATGQIMVGTGTMLDFEMMDSYMVTVTATDSAGISEDLMVTISINNVEEPGMVTLSTEMDQTLTADTWPIDDEDGLTNVSYKYQWIADGADIDGATGSTHELTSSEQGQTIQVRVTFTDDADNAETLTSEATEGVVAAPVPLKASFLAAPSSHDGDNSFTFELRFTLALEDGNLFFSPYSISLALAMTYAGARGRDGAPDGGYPQLPPSPGHAASRVQPPGPRTRLPSRRD